MRPARPGGRPLRPPHAERARGTLPGRLPPHGPWCPRECPRGRPRLPGQQCRCEPCRRPGSPGRPPPGRRRDDGPRRGRGGGSARGPRLFGSLCSPRRPGGRLPTWAAPPSRPAGVPRPAALDGRPCGPGRAGVLAPARGRLGRRGGRLAPTEGPRPNPRGAARLVAPEARGRAADGLFRGGLRDPHPRRPGQRLGELRVHPPRGGGVRSGPGANASSTSGPTTTD